MTRRLQTASPEIVALILETLNTSRANDLLAEARDHLAHPGHSRMSCNCPPCGTWRRINRHLRREPDGAQH